MRIVCGPPKLGFKTHKPDLEVVLYERATKASRGSAGAQILEDAASKGLAIPARAWDLMSLALSVTAADLAGHRSRSPDGWTREFDLCVAVTDPDFWNSQRVPLARLLGFLTTDRWRVEFIDGGRSTPESKKNAPARTETSVILLSGGLDSLIGSLDLASGGMTPVAVSQVVRGDAEKQRLFASSIGGGLRHVQWNHNADVPDGENPPSQRARSLAFLAYGVAVASDLERSRKGEEVGLFVCENGFIAVNPPLTDARVGSLSTRTAHPIFLGLFQQLIDAAGLRVQIHNPYTLKTKGEMLSDCKDQDVLRRYARQATSCGRFNRFGQRHCGRCVPCLVRRAAFLKWRRRDETEYVYADLSLDDDEHARFDDVRAVAMATNVLKSTGVDHFCGSLSTSFLGDVTGYRDVVRRGLEEVGALLRRHGVR